LVYGPYYRIETDANVVDLQVQSREIWGKASRNFYQSPYPQVQAYTRWTGIGNQRGIKFMTEVAPDSSSPPGRARWSGDREGVWIDDEYAKIKALEIDYYP
jgi:hypothetical protein